MARANDLSGLYVVFDGIVGCGKTAQINELRRHLPLDFPGMDFVFTYEPGGTPQADNIRDRLKYEEMSAEEEMRLFAESRAITIPQVVVPVLTRSGIVISDRSFTTSLTYQAFGRELGLPIVWEANKYAVNSIFPDILLYLKVGLKVSLKRSRGDNFDKFDQETKDFWNRVIPGYDRMIEFLKDLSPSTKVVQIDDPEGRMSVEETRLAIKGELYPLIGLNIKEGRILRDRQV